MIFNEIKEMINIPPAIKINWFKQGEFCGSTIGATEYMAMRSELTNRGLISEYSTKIDESLFYLFKEDDNISDFTVTYNSEGEVSEWFPNYELNDMDFSVFSETLEYVLKLRRFQLKK